jgi:hypothetical protein
LTMFSVLCVGGVVGNTLVLLTSIISFSQDLAFLLGSTNVVLFLAVSGGFVPYPHIESWIVWLQWISPIKYSFQAFTWSLLSGTSTSDLLDELELNTPSNVSLNLVILVGIFFLCAACSVLALSRQKEVRWSNWRMSMYTGPPKLSRPTGDGCSSGDKFFVRAFDCIVLCYHLVHTCL